jgi:hypothetical protein
MANKFVADIFMTDIFMGNMFVTNMFETDIQYVWRICLRSTAGLWWLKYVGWNVADFWGWMWIEVVSGKH